VVNAIRGAFDRMFWRQYADEIRLHPEAPAICCFLGMSQVSIVLFLFAMGLLAPLVHAVRYMLGRSGFDIRWFIGTGCVAAFIALSACFSMYWRYRLVPDRAAALDTNLDRDEVTVTAVKSTLGALIFLAVMEMLFR
jgi:hypothetical protein